MGWYWLGMEGERGRGVKVIFKVYKWDEVMLMLVIRNKGGIGWWLLDKFRFERVEV